MIELEALQKALEEGLGLLRFRKLWSFWNWSLTVCLVKFSYDDFLSEAYDKMQGELVKTKESLSKIFTSKDVKATVCASLYASGTKSNRSYFVFH